MQLPSSPHRTGRAPKRTESRCRSNSCRQFRQPSRSTKTRSPPAGTRSQPDQIIRLPKPAQKARESSACLSKPCVTASRDCFLHKSSSANQAFVRFAVESSTALAIALDWTCVLEPFTRRALVSRTLASTRHYLRGQQPWTDVVAGT